MTDPVQFMEEVREEVTIVHIVNERLIDPQIADNLARRLCLLIENGARALLIDMGAVKRISSVFFRSFIAAGKKAAEKKIKMAFYNMAPVIKEGFSITGLDRVFKVYDSEGKAMVELAK